MKLEALDKKTPGFICVATIGEELAMYQQFI